MPSKGEVQAALGPVRSQPTKHAPMVDDSAIRERFRQVLESDEYITYVTECALGKHGKVLAKWAGNFMAHRTYGMPVQRRIEPEKPEDPLVGRVLILMPPPEGELPYEDTPEGRQKLLERAKKALPAEIVQE